MKHVILFLCARSVALSPHKNQGCASQYSFLVCAKAVQNSHESIHLRPVMVLPGWCARGPIMP